jgi:hypothetical protein
MAVVPSRAAHALGGAGAGDLPVRPVAEEIIFVDNPGPTMTAIVQLEVARGSAPFAWLIPTKTKPKVELSSSTVFRRLADATAPEYLLEVNTNGTCKADESKGAPSGAPQANEPPGEGSMVAQSSGGLTGAYLGATEGLEYTFFEVAREHDEDLEARMTRWLSANGYAASEAGISAVRQYTREGFGWLAIRVNPAADTEHIRPIALTYEAERPVVPIRAILMSAPEALPLRVWVIGPAQAVPINVPSLVLNEARIDWTSGVTYPAGTLPANGAGLSGSQLREPANYGSVVSAAVAEASGRGFVSELAAPASQFRQQVWSQNDADRAAELAKHRYRDGFEAVAAARDVFGDWDGFFEAVRGAATLPEGLTADAFVRAPEKYRGAARVDSARFSRLLRELVVRPVAAAGALLGQAPYLTRLYTSVRPGAGTVDPAFGYNPDLAQIAKGRRARQWVTCGPQDSPRDAPWRIRLPHGGAIAGKGRGLPVGVESMPANLAVVALSTSGSGSVIRDNRDAIGFGLLGAEGASQAELDMPRPPRTGLLIGGAQSVTPREQPAPAPVQAKPAPAHRCSVTTVGIRDGGNTALLLIAGLLLVLRRRGSLAGALDVLREGFVDK